MRHDVVGGRCGVVCRYCVVCAMIPMRERMALRADKWWRSVWLLQMLMDQRGNMNKMGGLTVGQSPANLCGLKQIVLTDGPSLEAKERT